MPQPRLTDYAIVLDAGDNVATALVDVPAGVYEPPDAGPAAPISVGEDIPAGFKLAVAAIARGDKIYKYGYVIGVADRDIAPGECVHVHNTSSSV